MESYKIRAEYKFQKTKTVYQIEIDIKSEFSTRKRCIVRGNGAKYDISIIKKSCFFGIYYMFSISDYKIFCSCFPKDICFIENYLKNYIDNYFDCYTLATAISDICEKW